MGKLKREKHMQRRSEGASGVPEPPPPSNEISTDQMSLYVFTKVIPDIMDQRPSLREFLTTPPPPNIYWLEKSLRNLLFVIFPNNNNNKHLEAIFPTVVHLYNMHKTCNVIWQ